MSMDHFQAIQQIFSQNFLRIPDYQRGYAWEEKHWKALVGDIELLEVNAEHYTGTLVLHPAEPRTSITTQDGHTLGVYDIVDGQQRLTTLVILLDAVRRQLESVGHRMAGGIKNTYLVTSDVEGQPRVKLTLNRDTHAYFEGVVLGDGLGVASVQSSRQLARAKDFFRKYLEAQRAERGDAAFTAWLVQLVQKVTSGLKLTVYVVNSQAEVGVIFEVMNNRGKPLSEMEKVKNYLLYLASKIELRASRDLADEINRSWGAILQRLMAAEVSSSFHEDQMLRVHFFTVYNANVREWRDIDSIKALIPRELCRDRPADAVAKVRAYVASLDQFSVAYCEFFNPGWPAAFQQFDAATRRRVQHAVHRVATLGVQTSFLPIFASIRMRSPGDPGACAEYLDLCERYAFRVFRLLERRANAVQSWLFRQGHALYHGRITFTLLASQMRGLLLWFAPDARVKAELATPGDWYNWPGIKYLLYEYEEHLAKRAGVVPALPWEDFNRSEKHKTIEHVLPQTPTDSYWTKRWTAEQIKRLTHDLGNLCITFDNSAYGNKPFPEKKGAVGQEGCYANSTLHAERELAGYTDWTERELLDRRQAIVDWALTRWEVEVPEADVPVVDDDEEDAADGGDNPAPV